MTSPQIPPVYATEEDQRRSVVVLKGIIIKNIGKGEGERLNDDYGKTYVADPAIH